MKLTYLQRSRRLYTAIRHLVESEGITVSHTYNDKRNGGRRVKFTFVGMVKPKLRNILSNELRYICADNADRYSWIKVSWGTGGGPSTRYLAHHYLALHIRNK